MTMPFQRIPGYPPVLKSENPGVMTQYLWDACQQVFMNEIGRLAKTVGNDFHDFFYGNQPGALAKTERADFGLSGGAQLSIFRRIKSCAAEKGVSLPFLNAIVASYERQMLEALDMMIDLTPVQVGIIGAASPQGENDQPCAYMVLALLALQAGLRIRCYSESQLDDGQFARWLMNMCPIGGLADEGLCRALAESRTVSLNDIRRTSDLLVLCENREVFLEAAMAREDGARVLDLCGAMSQGGSTSSVIALHG